jgi:hypothetical protein
MRKILLALSCGVCAFVYAQNSSFLKVINNDSADRAVDAIQTDNGDYYLLSNTNSAGHADFQLTKTDGLGNTLWSYRYGSTSDDVATAMTSTSDNGFVICGYTNGYSISEDAFVTKVSSTGVLQWTRSVRTDSVEHFLGVAESINGDIYATGYIDQDTMGQNILVSRLTNNGIVLWTKHYGNEGTDVGNSIIEDQLGRVVVVGSTAYDSTAIGGSGDVDISLLALNSGGTVLIHKNIGTVHNEFATKIVQESANNYTVGGNVDQGFDGTYDMFLMSIDTNLTNTDAYYFGVPGYDSLLDFKSISSNKWMVATSSASSSSVNTSLVFEFSSLTGAPPALSVGGAFADGQSGMAITGRLSTGYSLFSSGNSLGATSSEDLYISKLNGQFGVSCVFQNEVLDFGPLFLSSDTFNSNTNTLTVYPLITLVRNTEINNDSTLCCTLEARVSADTITICEGDFASLGRSSTSGYLYNWTAPSFTSTSSNPSVSPTISTAYKLVVSSSDGKCTPDSAEVYVKVNSRLAVSALSDTFFCDGNTLSLTAASDMIFYEWKGTSGTTNNQTRVVSAADTFYLKTISSNGCFYYDTVAVLNKEIPAFSLGNDTTICENLSITFEGPADMASYTWNGLSTTNRTFTTNNSQVHSLMVIDSFGCEYTDEVQVLTNPNSPFSIGPDTSACDGDEVVLFAPSVLNGFIWNGVINNNFEYTISQAGRYTVEAYNSFGCPSYDTLDFTVHPLPQFSLGNDTGACDNIAFQLVGPNGMADYTWFNGTGMQTFNVSGPGLYYLTVESTQGCLYTDSIDVFVYQSPTISLGNDTSLRTNDPLILTPGPDFDRYDWSTGETLESISVKDKGKYSVTVTDSNGCTGFDEMEILSAVNVLLLDKTRYAIYPNPASNFIHVKTQGINTAERIKLIDNQGSVLLDKAVNGTEVNLNVSTISSGIYTLLLSNRNSTARFNVIIKR